MDCGRPSVCEVPKKPVCVDYVPKQSCGEMPPPKVFYPVAAPPPPCPPPPPPPPPPKPAMTCGGEPCPKPSPPKPAAPVTCNLECASTPCPAKDSLCLALLKKLKPNKECLWAFAFVAFPHIGGISAAVLIKNEITDWYENSIKTPSWKPPNAIFAPMWTALYSTMGYASYLVWRDGGGFCYGRAKIPLLLYGTQLALNWAWPYIFFKSHNIGAALLTAGALWFFTAATTYSFCPINQTAGFLMLPYLLWITWTGAVNFSIWQENSQ